MWAVACAGEQKHNSELSADRARAATAKAPASDIAAQTAAGMAMLAKWFKTSSGSTKADKALGDRLAVRARAAYRYAQVMYDRFGKPSTCSASVANNNCIGSSCGKAPNVLSPCQLYFNTKGPRQQLFTAAAALFSLTGERDFRTAADVYYDSTEAFLFLYNWNNVWPQGVTILASTDRGDPSGVKRTKAQYQALLKQGVDFWTKCISTGSNGNFCECARFATGFCCVHCPFSDAGRTAFMMRVGLASAQAHVCAALVL